MIITIDTIVITILLFFICNFSWFHQMYFVQHGFVEVVSEHAEPIVFDVMEKGRYFGEISVVFSCPRTASVRCEWLIVSFLH